MKKSFFKVANNMVRNIKKYDHIKYLGLDNPFPSIRVVNEFLQVNENG